MKEANDHPDAKKWKTSMEDELESHNVNNTWTLTELPPGKKAIGSKGVFKLKLDQNGKVVRHKSRLEAKGCSQGHGIDYEETFSPVVRHASLRFLFALAIKRNLGCHQMDAITAYLHGNVEEDIYMKQPEGFNDETGRVCKLNKAIYGLKQSGRLWNIKLDESLMKFGLKKSK